MNLLLMSQLWMINKPILSGMPKADLGNLQVVYAVSFFLAPHCLHEAKEFQTVSQEGDWF